MDYDVMIVGAGPADLCCARSLADTLLKVHVIEKQPEERWADPG